MQGKSGMENDTCRQTESTKNAKEHKKQGQRNTELTPGVSWHYILIVDLFNKKNSWSKLDFF